MAIASFSLAGICHEIKTYIEDHAFNDTSISISIGAPGLTKDIKDTNGTSLLNLFFYRFEPFGFDADLKPNETLFLKTFCLITAFGTKVNDVEAGENELDLLFKVIRLFHEHPVKLLPEEKAGPKVQVQFIFRPLQDEQINQIWSTQSNRTYQPSILYEIVLVPIPPTIQAPQPAKVRQIGVLAMPDVEDKKKPYPKGKNYRALTITSPVTVNTGIRDWIPAICLVYNNTCLTSLTIKVGNPNNEIDNLKIWVIGDETDKISKYSLAGAILKKADAQNEAQWTNISFPSLKIAPQGITIDPETISTNLPTLELDKLDYSPTANNNWQLQLFVERQYTVNNKVKTTRSNPVLITLWQEETHA